MKGLIMNKIYLLLITLENFKVSYNFELGIKGQRPKSISFFLAVMVLLGNSGSIVNASGLVVQRPVGL